MGVFSTILQKVQRHRDPAAYWRKQGARIGENTEIYPTASFARNLISSPSEIMCGSTAVYSL